VVPEAMLKALLRQSPAVRSPGSEFYHFPHASMNASVLRSNGWVNAKTRVIFHDFTVLPLPPSLIALLIRCVVWEVKR
jgi:hypothetical protein